MHFEDAFKTRLRAALGTRPSWQPSCFSRRIFCRCQEHQLQNRNYKPGLSGVKCFLSGIDRASLAMAPVLQDIRNQMLSPPVASPKSRQIRTPLSSPLSLRTARTTQNTQIHITPIDFGTKHEEATEALLEVDPRPRDARALPYELREHCLIYFEEKLCAFSTSRFYSFHANQYRYQCTAIIQQYRFIGHFIPSQSGSSFPPTSFASCVYGHSARTSLFHHKGFIC
jgi:hypothetical protein